MRVGSADDLPPGLREQAKQALGETPKKPPRVRNARRTWVDGIPFDSQREADRYVELRELHRAGEIEWFCRQPRFVLEGGVEYIADFIVRGPDGVVVEDVKGHQTDVFRLKSKQLRARYGIELRLI